MAVVRRGDWGGSGGAPWRFEQPPTQMVFTLADGVISGLKLVSGSDTLQVGNSTVTFDLTGRTITNFGGTHGLDPDFDRDRVQTVEIRTSEGTLTAGTVQNGSTAFSYAIPAGQRVTGFAGSAGTWLDSIGVLIETPQVGVDVSLCASTGVVSTDVVGAIDLRPNDTITWLPSSSTPDAFAFNRIDFYDGPEETHAIGGWTAAEGAWSDPGFPYRIAPISSSAGIEITDDDDPSTPMTHGYKLWVEDAEGHLHVLDPEIINFSGRPT